jgi:hypothetical protein
MFFQETFMHSYIYICLNEKPHLDVFHEITSMELSYKIEMGQWIHV